MKRKIDTKQSPAHTNSATEPDAGHIVLDLTIKNKRVSCCLQTKSISGVTSSYREESPLSNASALVNNLLDELLTDYPKPEDFFHTFEMHEDLAENPLGTGYGYSVYKHDEQITFWKNNIQTTQKCGPLTPRILNNYCELADNYIRFCINFDPNKIETMIFSY